MSKTNQLVNLLESLEKREFDKIVKIYLEKEFDFKKIILTDGKDDIGLDIRVFDLGQKKIQYQLTVQKSSTTSQMNSLIKKILEDLEKAKLNVDDYEFENKLIFFYSKKLTNKRIRELEKLAFKDYGINLEIIEANRIAEESENIIDIQRELFKINELEKFKIEDSSFENNLLYDLLSFGKPTEFKTQVIDSFMLQYFYKKEDNVDIEDLKSACETQFQVKENDVFYDKLLNRFMSDKKISKDKESGKYYLTNEEKIRLKSKNDEFELEKSLFIKEITSILSKFNQEDSIDSYIKELKELYINNFSTDLSNALNNDEEFHIFGITKDFMKFIEKKIKNKELSKTLSKELLSFCMNNKFIQKIAASKVYSSKIDNNRLESYLANKKKIFIDTAVGLYSLCYFFNPKLNYPNYFYKTTKNLLEFAQKENMTLFISQRYVWEMQNHINDAFNLIPFTTIPEFERLGSSKNVFYNYYNYLRSTENILNDTSFKDFLEQFGFRDSYSAKSFNSIILNSLAQVKIQEQVIEKQYDLNEANKLFEDNLMKLYKQKSTFTRNNDSVMLEFLADNDVEIHPLQPVFLTWDRAFFETHNTYIKKFPHSQNWLMLSPNKIVDVYSLLKFSINSETVTENLLALISDEIIQNTYSLVDMLSVILNPNDEIGLEYSSRLAKIRDSEINEINSQEFTRPENFEGEAVIDDIFFKLTSHYKETDNKLDEFKNVFTHKELIDDVIKILTESIKDFYEQRKFDNKVFIEFDKLIEKANKE